jgi:hypothetical protein
MDGCKTAWGWKDETTHFSGTIRNIGVLGSELKQKGLFCIYIYIYKLFPFPNKKRKKNPIDLIR